MPNKREQHSADLDSFGTSNPGAEGQSHRTDSGFSKLWIQLGLVWSWLAVNAGKAGRALAGSLKSALPNRAEMTEMRRRAAGRLAADYAAVRSALGNRATYVKAWDNIVRATRQAAEATTNAYRTIHAALSDRATYVNAWNRSVSAFHTTRAVMGDRATYINAYRATRAALADPATTWRKVSKRTATVRARMSANGNKSAVLRGAAALGLAAIVSMGLIGTNTPDPGDTSSVTVAADAGDHSDRSDRSLTRDQAGSGDEQIAKPEANKSDSKPQPVAGLDATQMENAVTVVEAGKKLGLSERGQAVALITAMQETKFHNYASSVLPESQNYDFDKIGSDHDSVGIFQQRPSMGWGSVKECMDPEYAATAFYKSLKNVSGWEKMDMTVAAQAVQGSAFPDAYAQWEGTAQAILDEVN